VETDTLHIVHRAPEVLGGTEILPGTYWGGSYEALQQVVYRNRCDPSDLMLFVGYGGWSPGQLERELTEGSWLVSDNAERLLFSGQTEDLWRRSVQHLGKDFAFMANMPSDPQLN
jgi:putative transcriptional regulator